MFWGWYRRVVSRVSSRRISPVVALLMVMSRSWMRAMTGGGVEVSAEGDVEELAGVAEGDFAVVDFVVADAGVGSVRGFGRGVVFGSGGVGGAGGAAV